MVAGLSKNITPRFPSPHRSRWEWNVVMSGAACPEISRSFTNRLFQPLLCSRRPVCRSSVMLSVAISPTVSRADRRNIAALPQNETAFHLFLPGCVQL